MRTFSLIIFICLVSIKINAQLDNRELELLYPADEKDSSKFTLTVPALGFSKNNEYFNKIADGYTLFGVQLSPFVTYSLSKKIAVSGGIFLRQDFGNEKISQAIPIFNFKVKLKDNLTFLFGTLEGSLNHRVIEPIYDFELVMTDRLEYGIQAKLKKNNFFADAWIDWENMIYNRDPELEKVSGGFSLEKKLVDNDKLLVTVPVQMMAMHKGGQIDTSPQPLVTLLNTAIGISSTKKVAHHFLKEIKMDNYYVFYRDFSFIKTQKFDDGEGWYFNLNFKTKWFDLMGSYWHGNEFISIKGGALYESVSNTVNYPGAVEKVRELFIIRFMQNIRLMQGVNLMMRIEPFYDFRNGKIEFSHGLYLNMTPSFPLNKSKE